MSILKSFAIDIPFQKGANFLQVDIKIRTTIFPDQIRPSKLNLNNGFDGFGVLFHYPKQAFYSKQFLLSNWPVRNKNASKRYDMVFELKSMEVVRHRNKWTQPCLSGLPNIDGTLYKDFFKKLNCKPPYWNAIPNLPMCARKEEMKNDISGSACSIIPKNEFLFSFPENACHALSDVSYDADLKCAGKS